MAIFIAAAKKAMDSAQSSPASIDSPAVLAAQSVPPITPAAAAVDAIIPDKKKKAKSSTLLTGLLGVNETGERKSLLG